MSLNTRWQNFDLVRGDIPAVYSRFANRKNPYLGVGGWGRMFASSINSDTFPKRIANDAFSGALLI